MDGWISDITYSPPLLVLQAVIFHRHHQILIISESIVEDPLTLKWARGCQEKWAGGGALFHKQISTQGSLEPNQRNTVLNVLRSEGWYVWFNSAAPGFLSMLDH